MQVLGLALLLVLSAAAEPAGPGPEPWADETDARRQPAGAGRQALPPEPRRADPCAAAREIVRQPPCLAAGDCEALQLWRESFGAPRVEPLDPSQAANRALPRRPPGGGGGLAPNARPGPYRPLDPGFLCPAGTEPPG